MVRFEIDEELTDEDIEKALSDLVQHNDSVLKPGETIFDFLASPEADFSKKPEGKMIIEKLSF